jgi:SAM-dependent methyltransferase
MAFEEDFYPESRFGGFTDIDGTIRFYTRVQALLDPSFVLLDFGCGRGAFLENPVRLRKELRLFKGKVRKTIGLDIDRAGRLNPALDEFYLLQDDKWPLQDNSIDICICDNVIEHLNRIESFFDELKRVLKHNSYVCIRTSNSLSYVGLGAKIVPRRFHTYLLEKLQSRRKEIDIFPTKYLCNTISKMRAMLKKFGFESVVYGNEAEPSYLSFSKSAYWLGTVYQKIVPNFMCSTIFVFAKLYKLET